MRTRAEIEQEYKTLSQVYGDKVFLATQLQNDLKVLHEKLVLLRMEQAADSPQADTLPPPPAAESA